MHALFFFIAFFYLEAEKNVWNEITFPIPLSRRISSWLKNLFNINLLRFRINVSSVMKSYFSSPLFLENFIENLSINEIKKIDDIKIFQYKINPFSIFL